MNNLSQQNKKKKGVSTMVSYALLIGITISLSILVANWLRFYASEPDVVSCPDNVQVTFTYYECVKGDHFNATITNTGLFTVDGLIIRVTDEPGATFATTTERENYLLKPGEEYKGFARLGAFIFGTKTFSEFTYSEVQPFINGSNGQIILCPNIAKQKIDCPAGAATQ